MSRTNSLEGKIWASSGTKVNPDTDNSAGANLLTIAGGNIPTQGPFPFHFNFEMNRVDALLNDIEQQGILEYSALTTYELGGWCKVGSIAYQSLIANNKNNTPSSTSSYWKVIPIGDGSYLPLTAWHGGFLHFVTADGDFSIDASAENKQGIGIIDFANHLTSTTTVSMPNIDYASVLFFSNSTNQVLIVSFYFGVNVEIQPNSTQVLFIDKTIPSAFNMTPQILSGYWRGLTEPQVDEARAALGANGYSKVMTEASDYTLTADEAGAYIEMTSAVDATLTIPAGLNLKDGTMITIERAGAGIISIDAESGVTLTYPTGNKIGNQYGMVTIVAKDGASDVYAMEGRLSA